MASKILIQVGALTEEIVFQDDTRVGAALNAYYLAQRLGPVSATNRQKLAAILKFWARRVQTRAGAQYVQEQRAATDATAKALYQMIDDDPTPALDVAGGGVTP